VSFLPKPVNRMMLLDALEEALAQDAALRSAARERQRVLDLVASLTTRERQVLDLVVQGYLNKQIAAELGTAEKTVKVHRGRVMHKLHARSVATLVQLLSSCESAPPTRLRAGTAGLRRTSSPASH
jgi:FixJ family two-component response regulator